MPEKDPTTGQFLKSAEAATAVMEPPAPEFEVTPEELEAAVNVIRSKKAAEQAKAEALANAIPGYPKTLYNPRYKWESIAVVQKDNKGKPILDKDGLPVLSSTFMKFANGAIVVSSPEEEEFIRTAVGPGRLFERDTETPQHCSKCQWIAYSNAAVLVCERSH